MNRPYAFVIHFFCGFERYLYLFGVVRIVVCKGDPFKGAAQFKSSAGAVKFVKGLLDFFKICAALHASNKSGKRVQHIVFARNGQHDMCDISFAFINIVLNMKPTGYIYVFCRVIIAVLDAERNQFLSGYAFKHLHGVFVITVINNGSGCVFAEFAERFFYILKISEEIQMILIHVQNNRHIRIHVQKCVVEFTGFTNKILAFTNSAVCINSRQFAADYSARIQTGVQQSLCDHTGGRCFSVCSANADTVAEYPADRA